MERLRVKNISKHDRTIILTPLSSSRIEWCKILLKSQNFRTKQTNDFYPDSFEHTLVIKRLYRLSLRRVVLEK